MANERLRSGIAAAGITLSDVAERVEVDPKTVERWITKDRTPHRRHRWTVGSLLELDEAYLWPEVADSMQAKSASEAEFVQLYPHRGLVPDELWTRLIDSATESIDVIVYAGLFLVDTHPDLADALAAKARAGVKVRVMLGDPESEIVAQRGVEEGIGEDLAARIRLTRRALGEVSDVPGLELRQHSTILYNSIYRFDSTLLANVHVYGAPAPHNPVIHLQRVPGGRLFDHFMRGVDAVWKGSQTLGLVGSHHPE